jgi:hypothetical protein
VHESEPGAAVGQLAVAPVDLAPFLGQLDDDGPFVLEIAAGEDLAELLLEEVGAVEPAVGLGDPGQGGALVAGQVRRVLQERPAVAFGCLPGVGCLPGGCPVRVAWDGARAASVAGRCVRGCPAGPVGRSE